MKLLFIVDGDASSINITYELEEFKITRIGSSIPMSKQTKNKRYNEVFFT